MNFLINIRVMREERLYMNVWRQLRNKWYIGKDILTEAQSILSFCNNEQNKIGGGGTILNFMSI